MLRPAFLAASLLLAAPALAAAGPHFQAEPAARPAESRLALRDTLWRCGDDGCAAAESSSRPAIVCAVLAREIGTLRSFSVRGEALSPDALDRCNARARPASTETVRTAAK
jgi:hypothetical protein